MSTRALPVVALVLASLASVPPRVDAQAPTALFDTAAAKHYTIGAVVGASRSALSLVRSDRANDRLVARVEQLLARVDRPAVARLPLDVLVHTPQRFGTGRQVGFGRIARWQRRSDVAGLGAGDAADLDTLTRITVSDLRFAMEERSPAVSDDSVDIILTPLTALHREQLTVSIEESLEKLNRFERKYGPDAPRLNGVEVGLNYVAQWIPLFMPNREGWPSRWEMVTSYVPTYLTVVDEKARPVTVGELGLRAYLWKRGWGGADGGIWRPGYLSFGVAVAGARDGAFVSPLQGTARVGAFLGWGEMKVAYLGGADKRFLLTRQMQVIPWVF